MVEQPDNFILHATDDADLISRLGRSGSADEKLSEEEILTSLTRSLDIIRDRDANYLADITPHGMYMCDMILYCQTYYKI